MGSQMSTVVNEGGLKQRLAAILAADVAGYSRLMAVDANATVAALDAARAVFRAEIESDLWEFHEDARRRGCSAEHIAIHMLARLCRDATRSAVAARIRARARASRFRRRGPPVHARAATTEII